MRTSIIAILILIAILAIPLYHFGVLRSIDVVEKQMPPTVFVFEKYQGSYKGIGDIMKELHKKLESDGIKVERGIGIYFDNPSKVDAYHLRSLAGAVIEGENLEKIKQFSSKYLMAELQSEPAYHAEFPLKGDISYMIAPIVVWPRFNKKMKDSSSEPTAGIEIYDSKNSKIDFYMYSKGGMDRFDLMWRQ
ncbi:MAG: hypothetical protein HQK54_05245 [Oligoflexales bacterium]|nr:hypothetical protein [Oligoflexales bacterium]